MSSDPHAAVRTASPALQRQQMHPMRFAAIVVICIVALMLAINVTATLTEHKAAATPNPLSVSNHALQRTGTAAAKHGIDPTLVLDYKQADALTGTVFPHIKCFPENQPTATSRTCMYYAGSNLESSMDDHQPTVQVSTTYEFNDKYPVYNQSLEAARDSFRAFYVPIDVASRPQLTGATAAYFQYSSNAHSISTITFTTNRRVTVMLAIQGATQENLLEAARVAIMNLGLEDHNLMEV